MDTSLPRVEGVEHRWVEVNGVRLHLAEAGRGAPVVMVHGWPQHWYMWRHQIVELAKTRRVICVDLRGLGWSDAPDGDYAKESLAADIEAVIESLGVGPVDLVGHDWGGWIGFLVCLRRPELVRRYVALNIPAPFVRPSTHPTGLFSLWYQVLLATPWLGPAVVRRRGGFIERSFHATMRTRPLSDADIEIYAERLRQPERARATMRIYRTFITRELWSVLGGRYRSDRLRVPTLVLFGRDDAALSPKLLTDLPAYADDVRIELIENAGHFVAEEQPELVTRRIAEFLAG